MNWITDKLEKCEKCGSLGFEITEKQKTYIFNKDIESIHKTIVIDCQNCNHVQKTVVDFEI